MIKQCLQCSIDFEAQKSTAKFHDASCRVAYNREHSGEESLPVTEEVKAEPIRSGVKHDTRWDKVCTEEQWLKSPNLCETKAQHAAMVELYDSFTAEQLAAANVRPPKWKQYYKTYAEMRLALKDDMSKYDLIDVHEVIDYSKWK